MRKRRRRRYTRGAASSQVSVCLARRASPQRGEAPSWQGVNVNKKGGVQRGGAPPVRLPGRLLGRCCLTGSPAGACARRRRLGQQPLAAWSGMGACRPLTEPRQPVCVEAEAGGGRGSPGRRALPRGQRVRRQFGVGRCRLAVSDCTTADEVSLGVAGGWHGLRAGTALWPPPPAGATGRHKCASAGVWPPAAAGRSKRPPARLTTPVPAPSTTVEGRKLWLHGWLGA